MDSTILIIDDDEKLNRLLTDFLSEFGFKTLTATHPEKGLKKLNQRSPDLVILDVMLPGMDGFAICREIRDKRPVQPVIILTAKGSEDDVVSGFTAGADDYVSKPFSLRELMVRVEAVLRRSGKPTGDEQIRYADILFDGRNLQVMCRDRSEALTRREMDIVVYLFRHRDRIVSKGELLTEVWNYKDPNVETRTVDIHMLKLRKKIASLADGRVLIRTVRGEGYRLEPEH